MGRGGDLFLINGTPYQWKKTHAHSYQMEAWDDRFPQFVDPGAVVSVYVEWSGNMLKTLTDAAGEIDYDLVNTSSSFEIQARNHSGDPVLKIYLKGMSTLSEAHGATIDMPPFVWNKTPYPKYNAMTFILSGADGHFICNSRNQLSAPWLSSSLSTLGQRSLRRLCLPESHDTGMSQIGRGTIGADAGNCKTQVKDVAAQLGYGVRVLDIRPVISGGQFYTGHYSNSEVGGVGVNGQSMASVIEQINAFTDRFPELVIIRIQNDLNTDVGRTYRPFTQDEWNRLYLQLAGLKHLFPIPTGKKDLTTITLNEFIGNKQAAVVVVFPFEEKNTSLGSYSGRGFYDTTYLPLYDQYADKDDPNAVISDQIRKMHLEKRSADDKIFNIAWTETQTTADAIESAINLRATILELADQINPRLGPVMLKECSRDSFPGILGLDKIEDTIPVAVATFLNTVVIKNP